ncbi:MAG: ABC transporter permease [Lachnospiraceae bacterium]|nr:ABC transporter permease [Lachnospiraceae bacterium]
MFSLMLHKLLHKKWMVLCLLIGNVLLIAVAVSFPLYRVSSFQKMLTDEFAQYREQEGRWPAVFGVALNKLKGSSATGFAVMEQETDEAVEELGIDVLERVTTYRLSAQKTEATVVRDDESIKRITLGAISDLENHIELLYGRLPETERDAQGHLEVMVSDVAMMEQDILIEDEYTYQLWKNTDGSPLTLKVVGIFRPLDETELFWEPVEEDLAKQVFVPVKAFRESFLGEGVEEQFNLHGNWSYVWDYESIQVEEVSRLMRSMERLGRKTDFKDNIVESAYQQILSDYSGKAKRIEATLVILQVPVLLLLCAFLYMIAGQMLQMERNEISLLRSRGASKGQIFGLYLMQSVLLGLVSLVAGLPLGALFCKMLGSATAFLEFSATRSLAVRFTTDVILYGAGAVLLSVVVTTLPVLFYSGISIVNLKQSRSRQKKSWWKKCYLDVILLAISLYGFYSFRRLGERMVGDVLSGNSLDPLLYVSFSLFILGAGLFCARLQPLVLRGVFALGKKRMKPSTYVSMLGTIRTGARQEFIIVFLILTVSIGISNTTIARTIVLNALNNTRHVMGADITLKEKWNNNRASVRQNPSLKLTYTEPDFAKYETIPGVVTATKVIRDTDAVMNEGAERMKLTLMGIRAKGFFDVTKMSDELLPYSYAEYLNVMAQEPEAVLVSENFMRKKNYHLGDSIVFENGDGKTTVGYIYGFFPYWPSYEPYSYLIGEDGNVETVDQYMIVANLSYLNEKNGVYPYEVWLDVEDDGAGFYQWLEEQEQIALTSLEDMAAKEERIIRDTMFQGTNGILSMSFMIILLLCSVGYLIYWIMSIRSRELLFGVLRAMGMRKGEITWLLMMEQICSGLYAVAAGGLVGVLASRMFVPMIQQAYAASEQVLPLQLITKAGDMIQLFAIIGLVLACCLLVLGRIVTKLNISSALKLGED